ncbi:hypothetical protein [Achromobacter sp. MFA1 R4]|uniref:hypothetical protein n=1 Tax=Achromobacter sp. MFA1 R4 TaxID=1881016 RepID=UPI0012EC75F5|nr:hypothetical protein [Achromobacter sp. MFA1 R4]
MSELMLRIRVEQRAGVAQFAWLNFQKDGSISIGLNDRVFSPPDLGHHFGVWSAFNREKLEYVVGHDPKALKPIGSAHLTFHPPIHFHLTKGKGQKPFQGIADVDLTVKQDGFMPWARIVSKPVSKLPPASNGRPGKSAEDLVLPKRDGEYSMGLRVDFLDPSHTYAPQLNRFEKQVAWHSRLISVSVEYLEPQQVSTMAWTHQF